jgi:hypothetical protein
MSEENLGLLYLKKIRQQLVFHVREVSKGKNYLTPRAFHQEVLPNFTIAFRPLVTQFFFEMTEIYTNKWVYHKLKERWVDYDK